MKINFLIPTTGLTGGVKIVFEQANNLSDYGHEVSLIYPYVLKKEAGLKDEINGEIKKIRRFFLKIAGQDKINWFNLKSAIRLIRVSNLSEKNIPIADVTIATANETADWLVDYGADKGEKFYFIQDYENWTREAAKVDATWKMPLKKIVITNKLKNLAMEKFQEKVFGVVSDGIDFKVFYNDNKKINKEKRILMMYHPLGKKGFVDGLEAFKIAKKKHPEIKLFLFGAYREGRLIEEAESFCFQPRESLLRELFSACDIFLWSSRQEGFGLPPLEAMACQCAVISTDTGAIREYAINGETALIVPPSRPDLLAEQLLKLLADDSFLKRIGSGGYEKSRQFSMEKSTKILEDILKKETAAAD